MIWAAKEVREIDNVKSACEATCLLFNKFLRSQIIEIVDADKKMKHSRLAESCEKALNNKKYMNNVDLSRVDLCYPPIIQSGGNYSFKFSVLSDDHVLHFGAIICSLGVRYRQYCSNIIRTLLVDPSQELQDLYSLLLDVEQKVIDCLKPGSKLCDVYAAAVEVLRDNRPELIEKFTKNVGFGMGIEFRESSLLINARNTVSVESGMVFNINVGIADIENKTAKDDAGKKVALFLGDTVMINEEGATSLTEAAKKRVKHICMFFKSGAEEKDEGNKENINDLLSRTKRSVVLQEQLRKKQSGEERRKQHQKDLAEQLNKNAKERLALAKDLVMEPK
ncbi:unnamed protein product [Soboliphyme baturini]|uniref:FACT complex subunit n=1 Tax=Soboliphyme baturini TaxID=241478 RepID=A0A183J3M1_9BILA|nr:unnamed protein product [Soboliphyme baturini]